MQLINALETSWKKSIKEEKGNVIKLSPNGHIFVDSPSIRRQNSTWKVCRDFIDFERRIHVEIMTSTQCGFDFENRRNIDEFSTWIFLCHFDVKST